MKQIKAIKDDGINIDPDIGKDFEAKTGVLGIQGLGTPASNAGLRTAITSLETGTLNFFNFVGLADTNEFHEKSLNAIQMIYWVFLTIPAKR